MLNLLKGALVSGQNVRFYSAATTRPKVAVVLSGCGVYDGSEVHEAAAVLAAITRHHAQPVMYAPDKMQAHVVNHSTGSELTQARNVLLESARIARGAVEPLTSLTAASAAAVVFPGGFGAAKNLSDFGFKGTDMVVDPEVERVIREFHKAGKPLALCCIAPILAAKVLGKAKPKLTMGNRGKESDWPYQGAIDAAASFGANMEAMNVEEVCVDKTNKLVSTPAFMYNGEFHQIQDGVSSMIGALMAMIAKQQG